MRSITRSRYNRFGERTDLKSTVSFRDDFAVNLRTGEQVVPAVKFEYMVKHKGMKVILTDHARRQAATRHGMAIESMKQYFIKAIDHLTAFNFKPQHYNQEIFIYSHEYKRGMIVAFRHDFKAEKHELCLVAVTCYPYGKDKPVHADTQIVRF